MVLLRRGPEQRPGEDHAGTEGPKEDQGTSTFEGSGTPKEPGKQSCESRGGLHGKLHEGQGQQEHCIDRQGDKRFCQVYRTFGSS